MAGNALYDVGMRLRAAELHDEGQVTHNFFRKLTTA